MRQEYAGSSEILARFVYGLGGTPGRGFTAHWVKTFAALRSTLFTSFQLFDFALSAAFFDHYVTG